MYTGNYPWTDIISASFQSAWAIIVNFIPSFIAALVVLIIGLLVASLLRTVFEKIFGAIKLDQLLRRLKVGEFLARGGLQLNSGKFVGAIVYWFFVIVIVLAVSDILGLWGLSAFLNEVLLYAPNIVVAALIMLAALVIANFLRSVARASVAGAKLNSSRFLGTLTWWVVVVFGFLAALLQLGVASALIQTIVTGIIAMLALAGGIAFGLGGKEYAAYLIGKFRESTEDKK